MNSPLRLVFASLLALAGPLLAADAPTVLPLWPDGAPGSAARRHEPEKIVGTNISNLHHPSLIVYLPERGTATGAAVIVAPGGGHQKQVIEHEGHNVARWLAGRGIAAFVLKYRLARDDANPPGTPQPYTVDRDALADAQRAFRTLRARAAEFAIRTDAIGILGFSAGGEVALLAATRGADGDATAADPVERQSARADFYALLYPGGLPRTDIVVRADTPPVFLAAGYGDRQNIAEGLAEFYLKCKRAGALAELHMYAGAGHGFGVRATNRSPAGAWIVRFEEWMADRKFLGPAAK